MSISTIPTSSVSTDPPSVGDKNMDVIAKLMDYILLDGYPV